MRLRLEPHSAGRADYVDIPVAEPIFFLHQVPFLTQHVQAAGMVYVQGYLVP